jgi:hypothetical protein
MLAAGVSRPQIAVFAANDVMSEAATPEARKEEP